MMVPKKKSRKKESGGRWGTDGRSPARTQHARVSQHTLEQHHEIHIAQKHRLCGADDEVFQVALPEVIDKVVRQDDESARKGRRDVADDDDGKDQNQSPEVAYQRHKLSAEAHDGRRDDGVQPPVAQEVVEGVPWAFFKRPFFSIIS